MSNPNDQIVQKLITEFNALQSEYQTKLTSYESTKENYFNQLQKVNQVDYCKPVFIGGGMNGNNNNVSQECYNQIWKEEKCTTPTPKVDPSKTLLQLVQDVFSTSTSNNASNKILCYGDANVTNINTATKYYLNRNEKNFTSQNNSTWVPVSDSDKTKVYTHSVNDAKRCLEMCAIGSPSEICTGATYDTSKKTCSVVIAPGKLVETSDTNKTAIYSKIFLDYSIQLNNLNSQLLGLMDNLETKRAEIQSYLNVVNVGLTDLEGPLRSDYATLIAEKKKLTNVINKYNDIEASYKEEQYLANHETTSLRFWTVMTIIIAIFIIRHFLGFNLFSVNSVFWVIGLIVLGLSLSSPSGFAVMCVLLLLFLILTINRFNI